MRNYTISDTNPNDQSGGGGCACSEERNPDTKGPFVVFYASDTDSSVSPHMVVCASCVCDAAQQVGAGTTLQVGDKIDPEDVKVSNPYLNSVQDAGDEVLLQRRIRAEQPPLISGTDDPNDIAPENAAPSTPVDPDLIDDLSEPDDEDLADRI